MRVLLFDTESTSLTGIMGRILCASFAWVRVNGEGKSSTGPVWTDSDGSFDDSNLVVTIRDTLESADCIVGWNSKLHDVPLVNARLAKWGERPVRVNLHLDAMWYAAGNSMKIGSRKLDNVAKYFKLPEQKTPLDWDTWQKAAADDWEAMEKVIKHCEADVKVLGAAYQHILPYVRTVHR